MCCVIPCQVMKLHLERKCSWNNSHGSQIEYFAHYKKILSYLENNDYKSAYEVQCKANAITAELCSVNLFDGVKVLLQYKGYDAGIPRRPNGRLDATSRKKLIDCYKNNMI